MPMQRITVTEDQSDVMNDLRDATQQKDTE